MANPQTLIAQAYSAFNHRDIDSALLISNEVVFANVANRLSSIDLERASRCILNPAATLPPQIVQA
jgi:hypothetical protein